MEITIKSILKDKISDSIYNTILRYERHGAKWVLSDDGARLYGTDKMLLLFVKSETIMRGN